MHRLLQGEVGSGKTLVPCARCCTVVDAGGQAALLAPTEVLAAQHHRSITRAARRPRRGAACSAAPTRRRRSRCSPARRPTAARRKALLRRRQRRRRHRRRHARAAAGEASQFADLGLVVVDEQHRFGVEQRDALRGKGERPPHVLVMTATPIPRTVAMTVFGDLETSTLRELPGGPVADHDARRPGSPNPRWVERTWQRVARGGRRRAPGVRRLPADRRRRGAEAERAATPTRRRDGRRRRRRRAAAWPSLDVLDELRGRAGRSPACGSSLLHGRLPAEEQDGVDARVRRRRDRRARRDDGRRGRRRRPERDASWSSWTPTGSASRSCTSCAAGSAGAARPGCACSSPSAEPGTPARERLEAVAATLDGFELAQVDLEQRREGDVLGAAQSGGRSSLRLLRVLRDEDADRGRAARGRSRSSPRTRTLAGPPRPARRARRAARGGQGRLPRAHVTPD